MMLEKAHFSEIVCRELKISPTYLDMSDWERMLGRIAECKQEVKIAIVGKYVKLHDAYLSVMEALQHGGYENGCKVKIEWIDSETVTKETVHEAFAGCDGMIIPGGFGGRGIEGKIVAARYAREKNLPYLGICLGMQIAVIEYARNVCGLTDANSTEFAEATPYPVIDFMPDQSDAIAKGGTMRLGAYP